MITRIVYFLIIVLITIADSFAEGTCTGTLGEQGHNCVAGEFWQSSAGDCVTCESGRYCPRISPTNNGIAYCCPEPFTQSYEGAHFIADCYTELRCDSENVYIYCGSFDDDNNCELDTENSRYSVQGYFDPDIDYSHFLDPKVSYQSYKYLIYFNDIIDPENPNGYHIELAPHYDAPRREQVPDNSWQPTSYTLHCVKNTMPCSTFVNDPNNYNSENNNQYDSISSTLDATNCPTSQLTNNATWDSNNLVWDVSECKCDIEPDQWIEDNDNKCMKKGPIVRKALGQNTSAPINTVHSIHENVIFDTENIINNTSAVCRKCLPDNQSQQKYYYAGGFSNGHVTHCSSSTIMGYYRPYTCSGDNVDWGESTLDTNPCPRMACPAGKTTTEPMPIGNNVCKYTDQTKFCDAKGCFNINDATTGGWDWDY